MKKQRFLTNIMDLSGKKSIAVNAEPSSQSKVMDSPPSWLTSRRMALVAQVVVLAGTTFLRPVNAQAAEVCEDLFARGSTAAAASANAIYLENIVGKVEEYSLQDGKVAAHIYIDSEEKPYFFFAFPAGNGGMGMWFNAAEGANLTATSKAVAVTAANGMWGAEISMKSSSQSLDLSDTVLGSMRFVRDRELNIPTDADWKPKVVKVNGRKVTFSKPSLDGNVNYEIEIETTGKTEIVQNDGKVSFQSPDQVEFKVRGLNNEKPLTAMRAEDVFKPEYLTRINKDQLNKFLFLVYEEKWAAGSPRYFSNFGRDRLVMMNSLMPAFKPEAAEKILRSIFSGMHPTKGTMSHEQHEGDFISWARKRAHRAYKGENRPAEDYKMVDDDFLFTTVFNEYLKNNPERGDAFLAGKDSRGLSLRELATNNFNYVQNHTADFVKNPVFANLIHLRGHEETGQWRDSNFGLGGGVIPFDVNTALVPGALKHLAELYGNSHSSFYDQAKAEQMEKSFQIWNTEAVKKFEVRVPVGEAKALATRYFESLKLDPALLPPTPTEEVVFSAISLDSSGQPVRIMHSDDTMMMAFGYPSSEFLKQAVRRAELPFPYGLNAKVAMVVANPMYASPKLQATFTDKNYHGRVSWLMQEILWVQGGNRQIHRTDLSDEVKNGIRDAQNEIRGMIRTKAVMGTQEVFAIGMKPAIGADGRTQLRYIATPFAGDAKSNSNQGWSHLDLLDPI